MSKKSFWLFAYKVKQDGEEMILRQKSEPEEKWPKKAHLPRLMAYTNLSNFLHHLKFGKKNMNCEENWICIGQQLYITMNVAGCIHHSSGSKIPENLWEKDTNKMAQWWSCDLWGKKAMGGVGIWYDCVLLLVNQENSSEVPYNKQKEFIKITEKDGRVRTRDWIQKV